MRPQVHPKCVVCGSQISSASHHHQRHSRVVKKKVATTPLEILDTFSTQIHRDCSRSSLSRSHHHHHHHHKHRDSTYYFIALSKCKAAMFWGLAVIFDSLELFLITLSWRLFRLYSARRHHRCRHSSILAAWNENENKINFFLRKKLDDFSISSLKPQLDPPVCQCQ